MEECMQSHRIDDTYIGVLHATLKLDRESASLSCTGPADVLIPGATWLIATTTQPFHFVTSVWHVAVNFIYEAERNQTLTAFKVLETF